jgi:hypothetical protein
MKFEPSMFDFHGAGLARHRVGQPPYERNLNANYFQSSDGHIWHVPGGTDSLGAIARAATNSECREELLFFEAFSRRSLDVHPPYDTLRVDQELPNHQRLVSFRILPIALDGLEPIEAQDRVARLARQSLDPQVTRHLNRRSLYDLQNRRRLGKVRQPVRAVRPQVRICGDAKAGRTESIVQARTFGRRGDDRERGDAAPL